MKKNKSNTPSFSSFMMAGFECTYALVEKHERFDLLKASRHDIMCRYDYKMIKELGIKVVREGLAWNQIDKGDGKYDFSRFETMMQIGQEEEIQQIWDLNHFDFPENVDPFTPAFITRFADYSKKCIEIIRKYHTGILYVVPINEISFFSWIGADNGLWAPYRNGPKNGFLFKSQLVRACIAAMDAMWSIDHDIRFIQVDPIMRRVAREPTTRHLKKVAEEFNNTIRFQTWDMLSGKAFPELGGHIKYLDIIGVNYYMLNQEWIVRSPIKKGTVYNAMIPMGHPDRISFASILDTIFKRYKRPLLISETGSHGEFRPGWWELILSETEYAKKKGIPIAGICSYPTLDKPNSVHFLWPQSGLWDFDPVDPSFKRIPHTPTLDIIKGYNNRRHKNQNKSLRKKVNSEDVREKATSKPSVPEPSYYTRSP